MPELGDPLSAKNFREAKTSVAFRFEYSFDSFADIVVKSMIIVLYSLALLFSFIFSF